MVTLTIIDNSLVSTHAGSGSIFTHQGPPVGVPVSYTQLGDELSECYHQEVQVEKHLKLLEEDLQVSNVM